MLFIDTTAQLKNWLHLGMADFPFSQAPFSSKVGVFCSQSTCFRVARWPECLWKLPQGLRKSVLAFMLVILQVKGILIYISQSDLLPAKGENTGAIGHWVFLNQECNIYAYYSGGILWLKLASVGRLKQISIFWTGDNLGMLTSGVRRVCVCKDLTIRLWIRERVSSHFSIVQSKQCSWDSKGRWFRLFRVK